MTGCNTCYSVDQTHPGAAILHQDADRFATVTIGQGVRHFPAKPCCPHGYHSCVTFSPPPISALRPSPAAIQVSMIHIGNIITCQLGLVACVPARSRYSRFGFDIANLGAVMPAPGEPATSQCCAICGIS